MTATAIYISAPSRLHFGLLRFSDATSRSFGGLGMMINRPRTQVRVEPSEKWSAGGPLSERALEAAQVAVARAGRSERFAIEVEATAPPHVGLGSGTQVALAAAVAVMDGTGQPTPGAATLAAALGRGRRSAVGSYGFLQGGMILEDGFLPADSVGRLVSRSQVPQQWRVVLIRLPVAPGPSGRVEQQAFQELPPVDPAVTQQLWKLATDEIVPAAESAQFDRFAGSLYEYGLAAGKCFATVQGGPFAAPEIEAVVERLRAMGHEGVGQSSWGPTIFAMAADQDAAEQLLEQCRGESAFHGALFEITAPDNRGFRREDPASPAGPGVRTGNMA